MSTQAQATIETTTEKPTEKNIETINDTLEENYMKTNILLKQKLIEMQTKYYALQKIIAI